MRPESIGLTTAHRRVVVSTMATTALTGVLWLVFHHFMRSEGEFGETIHPLERWWLSLHGAAGMLALLALGSLVRGHIVVGWQSGRNRWSGSALVGAAVILIATGWALYYAGNETLRTYVSAGHWTLGVLSAFLLPVHLAAGRRNRGRRR